MENYTWIIIAAVVVLAFAGGMMMLKKKSDSKTPKKLLILPPSELYVANIGSHSIMGFAIDTNGIVLSPVRIIKGPATGLHNPVDVAIDSSNRIWVANMGDPPGTQPSITVYEWNANGNAVPVQTISHDTFFLGNNIDIPSSIAIRLNPRSLFVVNEDFTLGFPIIFEFSMNPGDNNPIADIANEQLKNPTGLATEGTTNLFVATFDANHTGNSSILIFNTQPQIGIHGTLVASISGTNTGLFNPAHICFGPPGSNSAGQLFVVNREGANQVPAAKITVYAQGATGNVQPLRVIMGPNTHLSSAYGIAVDPIGRIFVTGQNSLQMFAQDANGNVSPVQTVNHTDISSPCGLVIR